MQRARRTLYQQLLRNGMSTRAAGCAARREVSYSLGKCQAQVYALGSPMGHAHFISLQLEERLGLVRKNRREALRYARYARANAPAHAAQFPQRRDHRLIASFAELSGHYRAWASAHITHAHRLLSNLRETQAASGLRLLP
jgi:hypothetical protein